jgi:hypothetical protein
MAAFFIWEHLKYDSPFFSIHQFWYAAHPFFQSMTADRQPATFPLRHGISGFRFYLSVMTVIRSMSRFRALTSPFM